MSLFGPGLSEARRFIDTVLCNEQGLNSDYVIVDASVCYSARSYPRVVKIFGEEHIGVSSIESSPFALMVFKTLLPPSRVTAYQGKKVADKELLIDENGYMWRTEKSWRVFDYENCGFCGACEHKGRYFEVNDDTEPHLYNVIRALDEIRETAPCIGRTDGYAVRLLKHFKDVLDKAFLVAQFGAMEQIKFEINLPLGKFSLSDGVLSTATPNAGLEYTSFFCSAVTAIIAGRENISCTTGDIASIFARMYSIAAERGTEDAYSIMVADEVGTLWWSTENMSDETTYNLSKLSEDARVQALNMDWDAVNTADLRRDHVDTEHMAGRLDSRRVSAGGKTPFGLLRRPHQVEYLQLDGPNQVDVDTLDGKKALLIVNESGAIAATTRRRLHWNAFLRVMRGVGVSPVTVAFDFSKLGADDECHTTVASQILNGYYGDKALRFLLEMAHKGRLCVNERSPCRGYVPKSCLKPYGVLLASAMPARAFKDLTFCALEKKGKIRTDHIYWKPTIDGNLFHVRSVKMNLVRLKETESTVEDLKVCSMLLRRNVS